jgi:hypothetical protein
VTGANFSTDVVNNHLIAQLKTFNTQVVDVLKMKSETDTKLALQNISRSQRDLDFNHLRVITIEIVQGCIRALGEAYTRVCISTLPPPSNPSIASSTSVQDTDSDTDSGTEFDAHHEAHILLNRLSSFRSREQFQYQRLRYTDSIRLVRILSISPRVECEIKTARLSDLPRYQALSYCWGKVGQRADITCNVTTLNVSANLWKGLRQLYRYKDPAIPTDTKWFWIDQICINQKDGVERTQQVRMMRTIYQQSLKTVIWLSLSDKVAEPAASVIADTWSYLEKKQNQRSQAAPRAVDGRVAGNRSTGYGLPPNNDKRWLDLTKLLEHPWFERGWILQEIAMSRISPVILCGSQYLKWSHFQRVVQWLREDRHIFSSPRTHLVDSISTVRQTDRWDDSTKAAVWDLQALLYLTRDFRTTDSRDKVFALLGLLRETRDSSNWPKELAPDYNRSVQSLYTDVTRYCIHQNKSLSILCRVDSGIRPNHSGSDQDFPSWVPRWDLPTTTANSISTYCVLETKAGWKTMEECFNDASKGHPINIGQSLPNVLRIQGRRINDVKLCLPVASAEAMLPQLLQTLPGMLDICKTHLPQFSPEELHTAFLQVTTTGQSSEDDIAINDSLHHYSNFLSNMVESDMCELPYRLRTGLRTTLNIASLLPLTKDDLKHPDPKPFSSILGRMMHRRLFITVFGHLGLGPAGMMSGDVVVLLFGGNVPYVLRPVENERWRFVGECYVHGIMQGEALAEVDGVTEWFNLV